MNELVKFNFQDYEIRLADREGNPWFVAKDVCDALGISNVSDAVSTLDEDEKSNIANNDIAQMGGKDPLVISESGLYSLILRSRKPEAKEFKRWVTHEVLPSIRKTSGYSLAGQTLSIDGIPIDVPANIPFSVTRSKTGVLTVRIKPPTEPKPAPATPVPQIKPPTKPRAKSPSQSAKVTLIGKYAKVADKIVRAICKERGELICDAVYKDKSIVHWNITLREYNEILDLLAQMGSIRLSLNGTKTMRKP